MSISQYFPFNDLRIPMSILIGFTTRTGLLSKFNDNAMRKNVYSVSDKREGIWAYFWPIKFLPLKWYKASSASFGVKVNLRRRGVKIIHTLAFSNSTNPKPDWFQSECKSHTAKNKVSRRLTSHDTTINNFAISIEEFGYIFGPSIRRKLCKWWWWE